MVRASLTIALPNPIEGGLRDVLGHRGTVARRVGSSLPVSCGSSPTTNA
jgi:hypothetical protein